MLIILSYRLTETDKFVKKLHQLHQDNISKVSGWNYLKSVLAKYIPSKYPFIVTRNRPSDRVATHLKHAT